MKKGRKRTVDKDGGDGDGGSMKKGRKRTVDKDG